MSAVTNRKRKAFSNYAIANYWMCYEEAYGEQAPWSSHGWDYGEPACMACGYWAQGWDFPTTVRGRWTKASLQKCHVIPFSVGKPEHVSNMVLMCDLCHLNNPHSDNPEIMYAYMRQRNLLSAIPMTVMNGLISLSNNVNPFDDLPSLITSIAAEMHVEPAVIESNLNENLPPYWFDREADMQRVNT